jgi:hypothetical protein
MRGYRKARTIGERLEKTSFQLVRNGVVLGEGDYLGDVDVTLRHAGDPSRPLTYKSVDEMLAAWPGSEVNKGGER